jgi:hypothetical protein
VSLAFALTVETGDPQEPTRELAIHPVFAESEQAARTRGAEIGRARECSYLNPCGETVRDTFDGVAEVQSLLDERLFDGMEVSSWLYTGDRLTLGGGWTRSPSDALDREAPFMGGS